MYYFSKSLPVAIQMSTVNRAVSFLLINKLSPRYLAVPRFDFVMCFGRGRRGRTGWEEQTQGCPQRAGDTQRRVCCPTPKAVTRAGVSLAPVLPLRCPSVGAWEAMQVENWHVTCLQHHISTRHLGDILVSTYWVFKYLKVAIKGDRDLSHGLKSQYALLEEGVSV